MSKQGEDAGPAYVGRTAQNGTTVPRRGYPLRKRTESIRVASIATNERCRDGMDRLTSSNAGGKLGCPAVIVAHVEIDNLPEFFSLGLRATFAFLGNFFARQTSA
jgi:hypothetical protein